MFGALRKVFTYGVGDLSRVEEFSFRLNTCCFRVITYITKFWRESGEVLRRILIYVEWMVLKRFFFYNRFFYEFFFLNEYF